MPAATRSSRSKDASLAGASGRVRSRSLSKDSKELANDVSSGAVSSGAPLVLLVAVWYIASCFAIVTSKKSMQIAAVPFTLCLCQFLVAAAVSRLVIAADAAAPPPSKLKAESASVWKVAVCYTFGFMLTNVAFSLSSAPFVETVKSSEPITTVLLAFVLLGERETASSLACLLPVVVGVALASVGDMSFSLPAFFAVQACNLGFSGRAVFVKQLKQRFASAPCAVSMTELFFHVHRLGLWLLVPVVALLERDTLLALAPEQLPVLAGTMAFNGFFYTLYNLFSFLVLDRVPTSVHAVLNVFRRVVVILITTAVFQVSMSPTNAFGVALAVGGVLLFKAAKEKQAVFKRN